MIGLMGSGGGADPYISISARGGYVISYGFGGNSVTTLRLSSDKSVYYAQRLSGADSFSSVGEWATAGGTASNYEVRARLLDSNGGTVGGSFDAWLGLGTTRDWTLTGTVPDASTKTATILVEIRKASTGRIVGSTSFILTAQRYS